MDFANYWFSSGAGGGYEIGNSLRFRGALAFADPSSASPQRLTRTFGTPTNQQVWTFSTWIKTTGIAAAAGGGGTPGYYHCLIQGGDFAGALYSNTGLYAVWAGDSQAKAGSGAMRDPGAWYHIVFAFNGSNCTIYRNGVSLGTGGSAGTNSFNTARAHTLFSVASGVSGQRTGFDGYAAETHFVDGQALAATDFGEFNADGVWIPKKVEGLTYGTNGFILDFSDPADIGADRSGNGNNFTPTGFELTDTTSHLYDWRADSPTNNYCTLNPLKTSGGTYNEGNLQVFGATPDGTLLLKSGKWYFEGTQLTACFAPRKPGSEWTLIGFRSANLGATEATGLHDNGFFIDRTVTDTRGELLGYDLVPGNVIGVALDIDANTYEFFVNNSSVKTGTLSATPGVGVFPYVWSADSTHAQYAINFGQRAFKHTPPTGFEPLSTAEMPDVPIKNPSEHFQTILDTGANILTNAQATFPNGLWWIKDRVGTNQHQLVDSVRGGNQSLNCPDVLTQTYVAPAGSSVAWCWGTDATGLNADAGFQMIRYTGNGNNGRTVAHSLNRVPGFVIVKPIGQVGGNDWGFLCQYAGNTGTGNLSLNANIAASYSVWGGINPLNSTSSFSLYQGSSGITNVNANGGDYMAYVWAPVPGYSAMGQYVGNANEDGPFIYTGFKPAWIMTKVISGLNDRWQIQDTARNPYNGYNSVLKADAPEGEESNFAWTRLDILSNGFKMRGTDSSNNGSGIPYFYIAFAEHPFGGANVSPSPAR